MSKHTPGPWRVEHSAPEEGFDAWVIDDPTHGYTIATVADTFNKRSENAANAHLIAAAPEMLAALKEYVRDYGDNEDGDSQLMAEKARAAIAKAEGRIEKSP